MGKVGSISAFNSILRTLAEQEGQRFLPPQRPGREREEIVCDGSKDILFHGHMGSRRYFTHFYKFMIVWRAKLGLPLSVICPIREPIARDVSAFFTFYIGRALGLFAEADLGKLEELFLTGPRHRRVSRDHTMAEHEFTLNWFDEHLKPLTRIDVYKQPFPIDRKWQIYRRGFTRVLVYRIDLKRSEQAKLISRFLGIKLDDMRLENATRNKDWYEPYSRFRESVKLPERYIGRMHNSRFAKHFWSAQELKAEADKWRSASSS